MGSVGTDDKFVMMDRVEDQLWELWIRVQWGMAYGMGQWMARCQVVECESSCWSLQCSAVFFVSFCKCIVTLLRVERFPPSGPIQECFHETFACSDRVPELLTFKFVDLKDYTFMQINLFLVQINV